MSDHTEIGFHFLKNSGKLNQRNLEYIGLNAARRTTMDQQAVVDGHVDGQCFQIGQNFGRQKLFGPQQGTPCRRIEPGQAVSVRKAQFVIAHERGYIPGAQKFYYLVGIKAVADIVAQAHHRFKTETVNIRQHRLKGLKIAMYIGNYG
jgi:hypothetical protein